MKPDAPLLVAAAIIRRDDQVLLAQRKPNTGVESLKWEFPGGKLEFGESPEEGLAREILEELAVTIRVEQIYRVESHVYSAEGKSRQLILLCYLCKFVSGDVTHIGVHDTKWVRFKDLQPQEFATADIAVAQALKQELS